jgi:hypothetical protein
METMGDLIRRGRPALDIMVPPAGKARLSGRRQ